MSKVAVRQHKFGWKNLSCFPIGYLHDLFFCVNFYDCVILNST